MRVCIEKETGLLLLSCESSDLDILLQNALNNGYSAEEIEVKEVTEAEFQRILDAQPKPPQPPEPDRITALERENALLALELAQTQIRLEQAEQEQAALLLELVSREVI